MEITSNAQVQQKFDAYPQTAKKQLEALRKLIITTATEIEGLQKLEETLKWGEPSYVTKHGSTVRIDWKAKTPAQYAIYFKCTSRLVETFKIVHKNTFTFEGKRAIVFKLNDTIPEDALKHCITLALTYHKVKHLPLLGA